jgi:kynurenine 3-monooxygenase
MNCGFEDCSVLNGLMDRYGDDWNSILSTYQELRKPDADAIADLALTNFVEMRDKVADPKFLLQKKIESWFTSNHPDKWLPAYAQVTFSPHIRYSEALANGNRQERIMQEVMKMPDIESRWQTNEVEELMLAQVTRNS